MRHIVRAAAAFALLAAPAFAQERNKEPYVAAQDAPQNPAVKGIHENASSTPVAGVNSFTESQARTQIEAKGYTRVVRLKKGEDGVWRGNAIKGGTSGAVSVDYQGNVN